MISIFCLRNKREKRRILCEDEEHISAEIMVIMLVISILPLLEVSPYHRSDEKIEVLCCGNFIFRQPHGRWTRRKSPPRVAIANGLMSL